MNIDFVDKYPCKVSYVGISWLQLTVRPRVARRPPCRSAAVASSLWNSGPGTQPPPRRAAAAAGVPFIGAGGSRGRAGPARFPGLHSPLPGLHSPLPYSPLHVPARAFTRAGWTTWQATGRPVAKSRHLPWRGPSRACPRVNWAAVQWQRAARTRGGAAVLRNPRPVGGEPADGPEPASTGPGRIRPQTSFGHLPACLCLPTALALPPGSG